MQIRHPSYLTGASHYHCDKARACATSNVAKTGLNKMLCRISASIAPLSCIKGLSAAPARRAPPVRATHRHIVSNIRTMWSPC